MEWLRENGYESVTISQFVDAIEGADTLLAKAVIIINDDGYAETTEFADILARYGFVGTYDNPTAMARSGAAIRALGRGSGEICGHTSNHANLAKLDVDEQRAETAVNKEYQEAIVGHPIRCFAYPHGAYNDGTVLILEEVGYDSAINVGDGPVQHMNDIDLFHIPRV
jgi:peptidoglycan/xylan/chitin deacetylase (PgdA/CDA1 family)